MAVFTLTAEDLDTIGKFVIGMELVNKWKN
jgi:hypothetical protein